MTQKIKSVISVKTKSGSMRVVEGEPFRLPDIDDDRLWEVIVLKDEDKGVGTSLNGMTEFLRQKGRIRDNSLQVNAIRSVNPSAHPAIESPAHIITIGSKETVQEERKQRRYNVLVDPLILLEMQ